MMRRTRELAQRVPRLRERATAICYDDGDSRVICEIPFALLLPIEHDDTFFAATPFVLISLFFII